MPEVSTSTSNSKIMVTKHAGNATIRLARNLSLSCTPCVRVAAIVVSETNDKLSPNIAPPTTIPSAISTGKPRLLASPAPMGESAVIVPIDVPMANEMKQQIRNKPGKIRADGTNCSAMFTVASRAPISIVTA